jgi:hypothetical protein
MKKTILAIFMCLFGVVGCNGVPPNTPNPYGSLTFDAKEQNGLTEADRIAYYQFNYGVEWLPYRLLSNMKRSAKFGLYDELFLVRPERFGLYRNPISASLPPIGITIGKNGMSGVNCPTCHTEIIASNSRYFIVDGANGQFAIDRFIKEMLTSMIFTLLEPGEFEDLYERMEGKVGEEEESDVSLTARSRLEGSLVAFNAGEQTDLPREIDAFTSNQSSFASQPRSRFGLYVYMLNRIKFFVQQAGYAKSQPGTAESGLGRSNPWSSGKNLLANKLLGKDKYPFHQGGPVSTPSLWGYRDSEGIFLSGVTNSMVERNTIQGVALLSDFNFLTYQTTLSIRKMKEIETFAAKIKPPVWNESLGKINLDSAQHGSFIFSEKCQYCHQEDIGKRRRYQYMDVGTDPQYHLGQTDFYGKDLFKDAIDPFLKGVKIMMAKNEGIDLAEFEDNRVPSEWHTPLGNVFEARPLKGCWASAPYLHNGSVRTIRELLKPEKEREATFQVGSYRYNTEDLGFENDSVWYGSTIITSQLGNSAKGHPFGTDLLESEKNDLIEFLKAY